MLSEQFYDFGMTSVYCPLQRCPTLVVWCVDVGSFGDKQFHKVFLTIFGSNM